MRNSVRVLNVEKFGGHSRLAAVVAVSIAVDGCELVLNGVGLMHCGSTLRVTYPRYRHPGASGPTYAYELSGRLRKMTEESALRHWFSLCGGVEAASQTKSAAAIVLDEPPPVRQPALR